MSMQHNKNLANKEHMSWLCDEGIANIFTNVALTVLQLHSCH
jgi:hypothetical protein